MSSVDAIVRPFQSILCPVDFSTHSRVALQHAVAISKRTGGHLTVMYADDPMLAAAAGAGYSHALLTKASTSELRRLLMRVGVPVDREPGAAAIACAIGRPAAEIMKIARRAKADLIVMGTQGRGGAGKLFFGSTTEQVLRHTPVPVLAVPAFSAAAVKRWPGGRLLGAIELGPRDRDDVRAIAEIARSLETDLLLAHVVKARGGPPWLAPQLRARDRERLTAARLRLKNIARTIDGVTAESRVLLGDPAQEIPALASDIEAALLVLRLRARHGLFGPRQGSITYRILSGSTVPVLALPPQADRP